MVESAVTDDFRFVPLAEQHLAMLHEWLQRPHVAKWWAPTPSVEELRNDYLSPAAEQGTRAHIAFLGAEPLGFIQSYVVMGSGGGWWANQTEPGARGIDQFLADEDRLGRGFGSAMVRAFVDCLFADREVTVIQTDPHPSNQRAVRCYTRAGFRVIGPVRTPDGCALLMRRERESPRRQTCLR